MIQFGLRLHDAEKLPVEQVLPLVRQKGFTCAHVALSKSFKELPCTPSGTCNIEFLRQFLIRSHTILCSSVGNENQHKSQCHRETQGLYGGIKLVA